MTVLFHGNFPLNREYMAGLLDLAIKKPLLKDKDLAKPFGYGAPFAATYRSWLHKTGMAELRLPLKLTPLGEVVRKHDPKFESIVTQWFLHHELVTDPERAEAWHYFASEFLPAHQRFTKEELLDGLTEKLRPHSEMHFGPGSNLNKQILRKIIQVYTEEAGLGGLGLIREEGGQFIRLKPKKMGPWKTPAALENVYKK